MESVNRIQQQILKGYEDDFGKHTQNAMNMQSKISIIWESIISQLSKENKKFLYQTAKDGARAREYEDAVNWLNDANIVNKIFNIRKSDFPISADSCNKMQPKFMYVIKKNGKNKKEI